MKKEQNKHTLTSVFCGQSFSKKESMSQLHLTAILYNIKSVDLYRDLKAIEKKSATYLAPNNVFDVIYRYRNAPLIVMHTYIV